MRTRIPMLVLSVIALVTLLGVAPQTCKATPVGFVYGEGALSFTLTITGGGFALNDTHHLPFGNGSWTVTIDIDEDAGFFNDGLTISGKAQHVVGPHGEGPNIGAFSFKQVVNAGDFGAGPHTIPIGVTIIDHGSHFDQFQGSLTFTVDVTLGLHDITAYTFKLVGVHTVTNSPIPEPATLILLATGLMGAGTAIRRRRCINKKEG